MAGWVDGERVKDVERRETGESAAWEEVEEEL